VDVGPGGALTQVATVGVGHELTPPAVQRGRIAFNDASASASGTFACASCHPDGHVDQLLWVIGGTCFDCDQQEPRATQPIRGLHGTLPLHWDGTLGDPFGGPDGANGANASLPPDCDLAHGEDGCFRHLVNASLAGVMCEPNCTTGPSGLPGQLDGAHRDDLAHYLGSVSYPPARSRAITDELSPSALRGFADFFLDHGGSGDADGERQTCADTTGGCHALPLLAGTNGASVEAFDAPTLRGLDDRFVQFSLGETAAGGFLRNIGHLDVGVAAGVIPWDPALGYDERIVFSAAFVSFQEVYQVRPENIFEMIEEMSTGHSGALGRQVTLSARTCDDPHIGDTALILEVLERAASRGVVSLRGVGIRDPGTGFAKLKLSFVPASGNYESGSLSLTRQQLLTEARAAGLVMTFTAQLRNHAGDPEEPQPLLATAIDAVGQPNDPPLPVLSQNAPMLLAGTDVLESSALFVDGAPVAGALTCVGGSFATSCTSGVIQVSLDALPPTGLHLLQVQSPKALLSNELPFCVGQLAECD
jgi:cytochrome c553